MTPLKKALQLISHLGVRPGLSELETRSILIGNWINVFIIATSLSGFAATLVDHFMLDGGTPGIGSLRLLMMSLSGMFSLGLAALGMHLAARLLTCLIPGFLLVVLPTLLGDVKAEYYFYFPFSGAVIAMIPILLFPSRESKKLMFLLIGYGFVLSFTADNLMSLQSEGHWKSVLLGNRYFFYKVSQVILFGFVIMTVLVLRNINTKYELRLSDQNRELVDQKEELHQQSDRLAESNSQLIALNSQLNESNRELEKFKGQLSSLVDQRTYALVESETRFRSIYENANDAIFILKGDVFVDCNMNTCHLFGGLRADIIGKTPQFFSPPIQPDGLSSEQKVEIKIKQVLSGQSQRFEWKHKTFAGLLFDAEVSLNRMDLFDDQYVLAIVRDITDRKNAELELIESERKFRNIFDESRHGIIIVSSNLRILAANKMFTEISGYTAEDQQNMLVTDMVLPDEIEMISTRVMELFSTPDVLPFEYRARFKNGQIRIVETNTSQIDYSNQKALLVNIRDVTEIREAEHKIMDAIIQTEEAERSRIAQDLHDGLGPVLSTIKLYFQVYQDTKDEEKKAVLIEKLKSTIEEAIRSVSEISHNISPHVLRNYGFYAAIRQFAHRIEVANVVQIRIDFKTEPELSPNTGIMIYRALSELINNSIRHSGCSNISIHMDDDGREIRFVYKDNGRGFEVPDKLLSLAGGTGLQNIINRIKALHGNVDLISKPGEGMKAEIILPK